MNIEQFGAYIAEKRKDRNMTQKDLAEKLNVTPKAVNRWERSIGYPDIENFEALESALGISVLNLFACSDTHKNIDTDDIMTLAHDSVEIDRKNNRIQEKTVSGIIVVATLLIGFLFYIRGFGTWSINCIVGVSSLSVVILPCSVGVSIDLIIQCSTAYARCSKGDCFYGLCCTCCCTTC